MGVQRHHVAAVIQAQVVHARGFDARLGFHRQTRDHDAATALGRRRVGTDEAVGVTQLVGQRFQRIRHVAGAAGVRFAVHVADGQRVHVHGLQLGGNVGGIEPFRRLFQAEHGEGVGSAGGGGRRGPGRGGQRERDGGRQGQWLCNRFHKRAKHLCLRKKSRESCRRRVQRQDGGCRRLAGRYRVLPGNAATTRPLRLSIQPPCPVGAAGGTHPEKSRPPCSSLSTACSVSPG